LPIGVQCEGRGEQGRIRDAGSGGGPDLPCEREEADGGGPTSEDAEGDALRGLLERDAKGGNEETDGGDGGDDSEGGGERGGGAGHGTAVEKSVEEAEDHGEQGGSGGWQAGVDGNQQTDGEDSDGRHEIERERERDLAAGEGAGEPCGRQGEDEAASGGFAGESAEEAKGDDENEILDGEEKVGDPVIERADARVHEVGGSGRGGEKANCESGGSQAGTRRRRGHRSHESRPAP